MIKQSLRRGRDLIFGILGRRKSLRNLVDRHLPPEWRRRLDQETSRIFKFYQEMRDQSNVPPEAIQHPPYNAPQCYPAVCRFARALEKNRDESKDNGRVVARLLGRRLKNQYKILYRLGEGGMGEVYAARRERGINRYQMVAVKTIRLSRVLSGKEENRRHIAMLLRRLKQESRGLERVANHENVVTFIDDGYDSRTGLFYIVTELIPGSSLRELSGRSASPLPPPEVLWLIREACKGIVAIHKAPDHKEPECTTEAYHRLGGATRSVSMSGKLLHRDVNPNNILFDGHRVKLLDLGLAGPAGITLMTGGTPGFRAPEQVQGDTDLDERVDVYSLGKTFYSLLCRDPSPTDFDLPGELAPIWNGLPKDYVKVILRATSSDRKVRYATAVEFLEALDVLQPDPPPDLDKCRGRLQELKADEDTDVNIWVAEDLVRQRDRRQVLAKGVAGTTLVLGGSVFAISKLLYSRQDGETGLELTNQASFELVRLAFYLRQDGGKPFSWDVSAPNSQVDMYLRADRDDFKLEGRFSKPVQWSILWHDTNDKWSCPLSSAGRQEDISYPQAGKVTIPSTDPPGTHVIFLLAGQFSKSDLQSLLKKPPASGPPPEVLGRRTGDLRAPQEGSGQSIRTADDYLKQVNSWLLPNFTFVKYIPLIVK